MNCQLPPEEDNQYCVSEPSNFRLQFLKQFLTRGRYFHSSLIQRVKYGTGKTDNNFYTIPLTGYQLTTPERAPAQNVIATVGSPVFSE